MTATTAEALIAVGTSPFLHRPSGINCPLRSTRRLTTAATAANSRSPMPRRRRPSPPRRRVTAVLLACYCCCYCPWQPHLDDDCATLLLVWQAFRSLIQRTLRSVAVSNLLMRLRASSSVWLSVMLIIVNHAAVSHFTPCRTRFSVAKCTAAEDGYCRLLSTR